MRRLLTLLLATTCLWALPSDADSDAQAGDDGVQTTSEVVGDVSVARPTPTDPIHGVHAEAIFPFEGMGLFATTHGFALSRRTALYHVEGGASISLDDHVRLTASYRMLGMDFGFDSDVESADVEPGLAAPFVGLAFDF